MSTLLCSSSLVSLTLHVLCFVYLKIDESKLASTLLRIKQMCERWNERMHAHIRAELTILCWPTCEQLLAETRWNDSQIVPVCAVSEPRAHTLVSFSRTAEAQIHARPLHHNQFRRPNEHEPNVERFLCNRIYVVPYVCAVHAVHKKQLIAQK